MLRNSLECITELFKYQDIAQSPEVPQQRKYFGELSSVSNSGTIPSHTSEVLRVTTAVEVYNKFKVEST
eukprot:2319510-Ditylum_brightwellii.AAC.1